jgi:hypothetical protein
LKINIDDGKAYESWKLSSKSSGLALEANTFLNATFVTTSPPFLQINITKNGTKIEQTTT